jgi:hypothetical protein
MIIFNNIILTAIKCYFILILNNTFRNSNNNIINQTYYNNTYDENIIKYILK